MRARVRVIFPYLTILFSFWPDVSISGEVLKFEQDVLSISTTQYGGFLIDQDGFIWIGTVGLGVYRYDGQELKSFSDDIQGSMISSIVEDKDGEIWIASFSEGITRYNKETGSFTTYKHNPKNSNSLCSNNLSFSPQKLYAGLSNRIWVGTDDSGLCEYNKVTDTWTHHEFDEHDANSLSDNTVLAITETRDGILWIGTQRGGLNRFDHKTKKWRHYKNILDDPNSLSDNWINSLLIDSDNVLWIGTKKGGLNKFNEIDVSFERYLHDAGDPNSIGSNDVWSIYEDQSLRMWVTHIASPTSGLDFFDRRNNSFVRYGHNPNDPSSLSTNAILRIYEHPFTNSLWAINSDGRIDRHDLNISRFRHWKGDPSNPNRISGKSILPIIEDNEGIIWVGTMSNGLNRIDRVTGKVRRYLPDTADPLSLPRKRITALTEDASGILWIGFWDGILASFDRETGRCIKIYFHDPGDPNSITESERLKYIHQDRDDPNILWLASIKGGLDKFDKNSEQFTHYKNVPGDRDSLSYNSIVTVYDDGEGVLWVPTYGGGLDKFDKRKEVFENYRQSGEGLNKLGINTLYEVLKSSKGEMWVASKAGISLFDPQNGVFSLANTEGIDISPVSSLLEDDDGYIWMGTVGSGIIRFDPEGGSMRNFTKDDGLLADSFFWTSRLKTKDGELWFGGADGISSFYPSQIKTNLNKPPIVLTDFSQDGKALNAGVAPERLSEVTLSWEKRYFEFRFSALNFTAPRKNSYAYMLEGWDDDWYYSGSDHFGRYSGLEVGRYTLRLKGANNDGVWNDEGISISVIISPPFWKTPWFYSVLVFLGFAIVFAIGFYVMRLRLEVEDRKRAEEKSKENADLLKAVHEASPDLQFVLDVDGVILSYHAYQQSELYMAPEDFLEKSMFDVLPPSVGEQFKTAFNDALGTSSLVTIEYSLPMENGDCRFEGRLVSLPDKRVVATIRNITERTRAEEVMRENEVKYQTLAENSQDYIMRYNSEFCFTYANDAALLLMDKVMDECTGKSNREMGFPNSLCSQWDSAINEVFQKYLPKHLVVEWDNGQEGVMLDLRVVPEFAPDGSVKSALAIARDITEHLRAKEERQTILKLQSIGTLAGGIAHDFNNILTGLFGNISMSKSVLNKGDLAYKFLQDAEGAMKRATSLTQQLLTFSKGGSPIKECTSIGELVEEVVQFDLSGSKVKPVFEKTEDLWGAEVDKGQIQQVISNLTINASQAMGKGGHFYITLENVDIIENTSVVISPGKYIKISLRDEGDGIDQRHLSRIFDPYFSTKETGSGLGLATTYSIISKHGGHISAESTLGIGTTFTLYLPASNLAQRPLKEQPITKSIVIKRNTNVLVMDDEDMILELLSQILKSFGCSIKTATDGEQAIGMYRDAIGSGRPFDVVIMDLTIPGGVGGEEAIKDLLEIDPSVKVIVSSGYSDGPVMTHYAEYGFKGIIEKPYTLDQLRKVLSNVLM